MWQTDMLCPLTGHFVRFLGSLEVSSWEVFVGVVSEKWFFLCVEAAILPSESAAQRDLFHTRDLQDLPAKSGEKR